MLLHSEAFTHTGAFTQRSFYTERLLDTEAFTHRGFYTEKSLYRLAFARRSFYTERSLDTEELLRTEAFTQRSLYTKEILHTNTFTQRSFYTQTLLHREVITQRAFTHGRVFAHRSVCTEKPLHKGTFTQGAFGNKPSPIALRKKNSSMIPWICSKQHKEYISEAAGPHSMAFKPTLRWHRGSSNPAEPTMSVTPKINKIWYSRTSSKHTELAKISHFIWGLGLTILSGHNHRGYKDLKRLVIPVCFLVGGFKSSTSLKNMLVSWDDDIPNIWKNKKWSKPLTRNISLIVKIR